MILVIIIMAIGSFVFEELNLSNSCYMAAAIEFSKSPAMKTTPCSIFSRARSSPTSKATHSSIYSSGESLPSSSNYAVSPSKAKSSPC
jgi:hypothetical protein